MSLFIILFLVSSSLPSSLGLSIRYSKTTSTLLAQLPLPSTPLDHITNTFVLSRAVPLALSRNSSLAIMLRPQSADPRPGLGLTYTYTSTLYRYVWDRLDHRSFLDCTVYPPLPNIAGAPLVELTRDLTTIIGTERAMGWFSDTENGTLEDHAEALSNIRASKSLPPISAITLPVPPEVEILSGYPDDVAWFDTTARIDPEHTLDGYTHVAVGGTFDRLHYGHRRLLTYAISSVEPNGGILTVGVTSDNMIKHKGNVESVGTRMDRVKDFVKRLSPGTRNRVRYVVLEDSFGPLVDDDSITALVCSSETLAGGVECNKIRQDRGLQWVKLLVAVREDEGGMSSSALRLKEEEEGIL